MKELMKRIVILAVILAGAQCSTFSTLPKMFRIFNRKSNLTRQQEVNTIAEELLNSKAPAALTEVDACYDNLHPDSCRKALIRRLAQHDVVVFHLSRTEYERCLQQQPGFSASMLTTGVLTGDELKKAPTPVVEFDREVERNLFGHTIKDWSKSRQARFLLALRACSKTVPATATSTR